MKSRKELRKELADFEIRDLRASVEGKEILKGVTLAINKGEVHAVMGPNGSGKSTLSHTLTGSSPTSGLAWACSLHFSIPWSCPESP